MNSSNFLTFLVLAGIAVIIYFLVKNSHSNQNTGSDATFEIANLKAELSVKDQKLGELQTQLIQEKSARDEFTGKNKIMFAELERAKNDIKNLQSEKEKLQNLISKFEEQETRQQEQFNLKVRQLDEVNRTLEEEKKRIRREDEERLEKQIKERDRIWSEHETTVKQVMLELTKQPEFNFKYFDNKNLPEGFSGKLKPDFLIEFLDQYVIFDAKISKSDNLQTYLNDNVKKTVEKIKLNPSIYNMVFFVVPTEAITSLTKTRYLEQGYFFFIIPTEAIPVILTSFKKISNYELAEQMDPKERENIISLIAEFDYHINMRNALDILASQHGLSVLEKANILKGDVREQVNMQKSKIRLQQFAPTEMKNLILDKEKQSKSIQDLVEPKVAISGSDLAEGETIIQNNHLQ